MERLLALIIFLSPLVLSSQSIEFKDFRLKDALIDLGIDTNQNGEIEEGEAINVDSLDLSNRNLGNIDEIEYFENLVHLDISDNRLVKFIAWNLTILKTLDCSNNPTSPDFQILGGFGESLEELNISGCNLTRIRLTNNLKRVNLSRNRLIELDVTRLTDLEYLDISLNGTNPDGTPQIREIDLSNNVNLKDFNCERSDIKDINLSGNTALRTLNCSVTGSGILNVSSCTNLDSLEAFGKAVTELNVTGCTNLRYLRYGRSLSRVDLSTNINLETYWATHLTDLDVSHNTELRILNLESRNSSIFSVTGIPNLTKLEELLIRGGTTSLDLSQNKELEILDCQFNQLSSLDLSQQSKLRRLLCGDNLLESLNINNGSLEEELLLADNSNLKVICADEAQLSEVQGLLEELQYETYLSSDCSFFQQSSDDSFISGNIRFAETEAACADSDIQTPFIEMEVERAGVLSSLISTRTGAYKFWTTPGSYQLRPSGVYSDLFDFAPQELSFNINSTQDKLVQDFCLVPHTEASDLRISILPLSPLRPGGNADFKIVYRNVGSTTLSGQIELELPDELVSMDESVPSYSSNSDNKFQWSYTDLTPFETREILFSLELNSPMDVPPLNLGDILKIVAEIKHNNTELNPSDNIFTLYEEVINAYDPNDITCLEGKEILPQDLGPSVHYMVRFENTGNASAINVTVRDTLDEAYFNIQSLEMIESSHEVKVVDYTGPVVDFVFEDINLSADAGSNQGYFLFKIDLNTELGPGDVFKDKVDIYFDYNFPITTNLFETNILAPSSIKESSKSDYSVEAFPNPGTTILNIHSPTVMDFISLSSITGKVVWQQYLDDNVNNFTIDLPSYKGVLLLTVISGDKVHTEKVVVDSW